MACSHRDSLNVACIILVLMYRLHCSYDSYKNFVLQVDVFFVRKFETSEFEIQYGIFSVSVLWKGVCDLKKISDVFLAW